MYPDMHQDSKLFSAIDTICFMDELFWTIC